MEEKHQRTYRNNLGANAGAAMRQQLAERLSPCCQVLAMQFGECPRHGGDRLVPKPSVIHQDIREQVTSKSLRPRRRAHAKVASDIGFGAATGATGYARILRGSAAELTLAWRPEGPCPSNTANKHRLAMLPMPSTTTRLS